ncbi:MAG: hypothetical protein JNK30_20550 [Phenylobacterium sp.]|uniref:hypothetical protein n=1 Tax=Phenylobacterium sp. TaxID=1871053 RepID=UPI001A373F82|nr:hypothetical protein [Phenylobacterium sp.]MBL8773788.1 hypothetical protein [Phenylobacterium sp.]
MSVDWRATAQLMGGLALGLVVVGMILQTIADVSLRKRGRVAALGLALVVGGYGLSEALLTAAENDLLPAVGGLLALGLLLATFFVRNTLSRRLGQLSAMLGLAVVAHSAWRNDQMGQLLWTAGVLVGVLAVVVAGDCLQRKLSKSKPGRRAHA